MYDDNETMLTTYDNPFNPFTEFEAWFKYDYFSFNCCGLLGRLACISSVNSDEVNDQIIQETMEEIVRREPRIYRIVHPSDYPNQSGDPRLSVTK